jgi:hypothetical protein
VPLEYSIECVTGRPARVLPPLVKPTVHRA